MRAARNRRRRRGELAALALALTLATWPAWRLLAIGSQPTLDELLALRCTAAP